MAHRLEQRQWLGLLLVGLFTSTAASSSPAMATYGAVASTSLFTREQCPANTFQCSTDLSPVFSDICCQNGHSCALDANNQPACCPSGAVCTGTAPASAPTNRPNAPVSFVPNSYFSFPYAPTDFEDRQACTSAVSACSRNYDACTSGLQGGGGFAVTIDVPGGGGTTVGAGVNLGASATSVCSSLSSQACRDLEPTSCETFNSASTSIRAPASSAVFFAVAVGAMFASVLFG